MYRFISKLYPRKLKENYIATLKYLDFKVDPERYIGFITLVVFFLSIISAFILGIFYSKISPFLSWIGFFILYEFLFYLPLNLKTDNYSKKVEAVLPDALQVMASNLRAGLTIDQALLSSSKPEFGVFEKEMNRIGKEIATGTETTTALLNSAKRIKSEKYKKAIMLIVSGLRSGGRLSDLLSQTSENIRRQRLIEEKIRSNVMMYVIFIFAAIALGAPILFGLSSFLVNVLTSIFTKIDVPDAALTGRLSLPIISFSELTISKEFILKYSIVTLVTSSIMGSLIIGLIAKGKAKYGVKYIPFLILASLLVFFITRSIISNILSSLISF
jgi:pilus assembly protein TadC